MGENICKQYDQQRDNIQNIQAAHVAQYQENQQPNQKKRRRLKQTFLQRRPTDG